MSMARGVLVVLTEPDPRYEEEYNAWYDDEHMAERLSIPGFVSARRWRSATTAGRYLATYEVESIDVFTSAAYLAHYGDNQSPWSKRVLAKLKQFRRWTAEQISPGDAASAEGQALFLSVRDCPQPLEGEFNRWYDEEHVPLLERVPGMLRARRFLAKSGEPKYLALYDLANADLPGSEAWRASIETPWAKRMLATLDATSQLQETFVAYERA